MAVEHDQSPDLKIWQSRWDSLNVLMGKLASHYNYSSFSRHAELDRIMACLQAFAQAHFTLCYTGLTSCQSAGIQHPLEVPQPETKQSPKLFPEGVLGAILDQVGYDMEVFQRIADQRGHDTLRQVLDQADKIAWKYLEPIKDKLETDAWIRDGPATVMTYFQKSPSIRVIPYAPVALIGMPFTCVPATGSTIVEEECLTIPHEVGHYVFWRGQVTSSNGEAQKDLITHALAERLSLDGYPMWIFKWAEEIFADVYGCLLAGRDITQSCEEIQCARIGKQFIEDDGEHPIPALRPYVYYQTLGKMHKLDPAQEENWKVKLKERGIPSEDAQQRKFEVRLSDDETNDETKTYLFDVKQKMSGVVDIVYGLIQSNSLAQSAEEDVSVPSLNLKQGAEKTLWHTWLDKHFPGLSIPDDPARMTAGEAKRIDYDTWKSVLKARQWTTKWPNGRWK